MLDLKLIEVILMVAISASVLSTAIIQKMKEQIKNKKILAVFSLIISTVTGFLFAISFSELNWQNCIWVGICTYVGADAIYKVFEDKIFKSYESINKNANNIVGEIKKGDVNE